MRADRVVRSGPPERMPAGYAGLTAEVFAVVVIGALIAVLVLMLNP